MKHLISLLAFSFLIGCDGEKRNVAPSKDSPEEAATETKPPEAVSVNPNLKYEVQGDAVTITGCDKKASGELIIPSVIEGNPVTSIGDEAFYDCRSLTSITIPDDVTTIGYLAFYNCTSLTNITIPDDVTNIGERALAYCYRLTSITIPDGVNSIGKLAFAYCRSLTSITIPDGVTSIGKNAFLECTSLMTIEVSMGNMNYTDVEGVLFNRGKTLLNIYPADKAGANYVIPNSVTSIGNYAFWSCTSLTSITIPDSVTSIGDYAFGGCESLTSITIPDGVTSIGKLAFHKCTNLSAVIFLGDAPKIEDYAFNESLPTIYREPDAKGWGDTLAGRPVKLITEKPVEEKLTADEVLEIANQPHQPIVDIPQLITAKLKIGMWERETTFDINESYSQKAKSINRKSLKRIKHVKGKYVVIQTYDEKGNKVFTEVHSYNKKAEKLISVGISAKGESSRMIGIPDLKKHSIKWVKQSAQSDQILQTLITCSQDGKSFQIKGSDKVGKKIIASWAGIAKWTDNLNAEPE
ncbi:leucine-rich repeat domain-containing protein [Akkermansiaceae bacterium]|nr:leucine-rich repeat domain-containing protein [Akkermansiaceae bacterium]